MCLKLFIHFPPVIRYEGLEEKVSFLMLWEVLVVDPILEQYKGFLKYEEFFSCG